MESSVEVSKVEGVQSSRSVNVFNFKLTMPQYFDILSVLMSVLASEWCQLVCEAMLMRGKKTLKAVVIE